MKEWWDADGTPKIGGNHWSYRGVSTFIQLTPTSPSVLLSDISRINKKGSQKDMEQKKAGAYFFYDEDDVDDIDDDDL